MATKGRKSFALRFGIRSLLLLMAISAISLFGYQKWTAYQKLENAREWVNNQESVSYFQVACPPQVSEAEKIPTLVAGAVGLESSNERVSCLKILAEQYPLDCLDALAQIALRSNDAETQRIAIHLISLFRDVDVLPRLSRFAKSEDPKVRAARLDCIGFTRKPTYEYAVAGSGGWGAVTGTIECSPPISTFQIFLKGNQPNFPPPLTRSYIDAEDMSSVPVPFQLKNDFPDHYRYELEQVMLADDSSPEARAAAARAIVAWPPHDYQLRYAEWGVWINSEGQFHLVDSIIDEIPKFVHRTGNELESFTDRLTIPMIITKPVIHLTTNKPMAIDLDVAFNNGRPWFAFPRPDDFQLLVTWGRETDDSAIADLKQSESGQILKVREGYPWILPSHRQYATLQGNGGEIGGLGLHWQSAIVSPSKLAWMNPPVVDPDPKYKWWSDLRDVQCSWVSNLNESERFLYYDGPTLAKSPVDINYSQGKAVFAKQKLFSEEANVGSLALSEILNSENARDRDGFYIKVDENGASGKHLMLSDGVEVDLEDLELSDSKSIRALMLEKLKEAGLNEHEANGLIKCWTPAFFEEPGQRIVFLLHKEEYDLMCPMEIRPLPTETARVGLVLTELLD